MAAKYQTIISDYNYKMAIYDNCGYCLQSNGKRIRIKYDEIYWHGNTGGLRSKTVYLSRDYGRKVLNAIRCAKATFKHGNCMGYSELEIVSAQLDSNWSNCGPSIGIN